MISKTFNLYEGRDDVTLTSYLVSDSPDMLDGQNRPAIIVCPGGAYVFCSDREAEPVALRFAGMGYHTFVLRYSTFMEGKGAWPDDIECLPDVKPHLAHPAPIREIGMAMLLIRQNAKIWHVDTDQIGICGFSAGGHNCAMYSTYWHTDMVAGALGVDAKKIQPSFCILGYAFTDYVYHSKLDFNGYLKKAYQWMYLDYFGTVDPTDIAKDESSPNLHVTEQNPPTFLWTTAEDQSLPVQHTIRMAHALADHGVPFELHIFEKGPHGLALADLASAGSETEINADVAKWVPLAGTWLKKHVKFPIRQVPTIS